MMGITFMIFAEAITFAFIFAGIRCYAKREGITVRQFFFEKKTHTDRKGVK